MTDDTTLKLQQKIVVLERRVKLLEEGLHQAERLRQVFDRMAQELKSAKTQLEGQGEVLEEKVRERTRQLMAAQEELVRKEKLALLVQIADTVGHELRNPLGVMNNAVYYLQSTLPESDKKTQEYLGIIKNEIADAERIVSTLLDTVRTKPSQREVLPLAMLLQQTLRTCRVPDSVAVRLAIPENIPGVRIDPIQMQQVFSNLITNSVEAMPNGGVLEIGASTDSADNTVTVSIRDSGSGITPEHQSMLFQPMFTTKTRRIGLGLVIVKNLTEANGGSVRVETEVGKHSTFFVTLPAGLA